jgi:hypothetical protein
MIANEIHARSFCDGFFTSLASFARGDLLLTYSVGNSLTYDIQYLSGLDDLSVGEASPVLSGYHIMCARPLTYIVQNPSEVCITPPAQFGTLRCSGSCQRS